MFPEQVLLLVLLHPSLDLLCKLFPCHSDLDLPLQMDAQKLIAFFDLNGFQSLLLLFVVCGQVHGNLVKEPAEAFHVCVSLHGVFVQLGIVHGKLRKKLLHLTKHGLL